MTQYYPQCLELFEKQWPEHVSFIDDATIQKIDDTQDLVEAEKRFEELELKSGLKTIFQYGLGAGFDFIVFKPWLEKDPERLLIILEDDFSSIKAFFGTETALHMLSHPQCLLVPIETDLGKKSVSFPTGFEMLLHIGIRETYLILCSQIYEEQRSDYCKFLKQSIHVRIQDFIWLFAFSNSERIKEVVENLTANLPSLPSMLRGRDLFKKFVGVPSLICAAGPSIKSQLPKIKQLQNRALLFGAGTGMNVLNGDGIIPHFGCGIDPNKTSESRMLTNTAFTVPYFQTMQFNASAARLLHSERLFFRGPESYGAINWILTKLGIEEKKVHFNISTTCACLSLADHLKSSPIVFLGLDLSYTESKRYPEGIVAHPTDKKLETEFIEQLPKDRVIPVTNSLGKRIFTRSDWINEGAYYSFFARQKPELKLINGTMEGLKIQNAEDIPLEEVEQKYLTRSYDLGNWVHAEIMMAEPLPIEYSHIQEVVGEWKDSLEQGDRLIKEMILDLLEADDKITDYPDHLGSEKYRDLEQALKQEPVYDFLIKEMDFAFEKKMMRDMIFLRFHSHLWNREKRYKKMFLTELYRLKYLHKYVEIQLKVIKKMDWSTSLSPIPPDETRKCAPVPETGYLFGEGVLKIVDRELKIDLEEAFSPEAVTQAQIEEKGDSLWVYASGTDSAPHGECLQYDAEGWLKGKCYYNHGKLHGPSYYYSKAGAVLAVGWFFNDERQGINLQFYPSGNLFSVLRYRQNQFEGEQLYYEENGTLKTRLHFRKGLLHGRVELFYPDGAQRRIIDFADGKRGGMELHYLPGGSLIRESQYDRGRPVGTARKWYPNGQLMAEKTFLDNEGNYDLRKWSKEGRLTVEKIHMPDKISDDITRSQAERTRSLDQLKKKMERLVNDQEQ